MRLIGLVLALGLTIPLLVEAQSPVARIGLLGPAEEPRFSEISAGLKQGLFEQGYRADTIHVVEGRTQRGDRADVGATVQALAAQRVAVLFIIGSALVRVARDTAPDHRVARARPTRPPLATSRRLLDSTPAILQVAQCG